MAVTYAPSGGFSFRRSYITGIQVTIANGWFIETIAKPIITARINLAGNQWQRIQYHILPEFWGWSSNSYTLDYVLTRVNTFNSLGSANEVTTFTFGFGSDSMKKCFYLHCLLPGGTKLFQVSLPDPPTPYWRPIKTCSEILS
jgi:hypothetical protein